MRTVSTANRTHEIAAACATAPATTTALPDHVVPANGASLHAGGARDHANFELNRMFSRMRVKRLTVIVSLLMTNSSVYS